MTTIEKPSSKKAKSFKRFSGTQDHGAAESAKQHRYDADERAYNTHNMIKNLKQHVKIDVKEGVADHLGYMTPYELEQEANKLLEADSNRQEAITNLQAYEEAVHEARTGDVDQLKRLLARFEQAYMRRVELVIDKGIGNLNDEEKAELKELDDELDDLDEQITDLMRDEGRLPTIGEYEGRTEKEIRDSMARAATLDTFADDDFGDYSDSHVRISNRPR